MNVRQGLMDGGYNLKAIWDITYLLVNRKMAIVHPLRKRDKQRTWILEIEISK